MIFYALGAIMKKLLAVVLSAALASSVSLAADVKKVYVNQIVEHPALDMTAKGIRDGLKDRGFVEGENLDFVVESAQANVALAAQIRSEERRVGKEWSDR